MLCLTNPALKKDLLSPHTNYVGILQRNAPTFDNQNSVKNAVQWNCNQLLVVLLNCNQMSVEILPSNKSDNEFIIEFDSSVVYDYCYWIDVFTNVISCES